MTKNTTFRSKIFKNNFFILVDRSDFQVESREISTKSTNFFEKNVKKKNKRATHLAHRLARNLNGFNFRGKVRPFKWVNGLVR